MKGTVVSGVFQEKNVYLKQGTEIDNLYSTSFVMDSQGGISYVIRQEPYC